MFLEDHKYHTSTHNYLLDQMRSAAVSVRKLDNIPASRESEELLKHEDDDNVCENVGEHH